MTWDQLQAFIRKMPPSECRQEVRFVEPYDDEKAGYNIEIHYAREDISVGGGDEREVVFVEKGQPFFR